MSKFEKYIKEAKEARKIPQAKISKLSTTVRKAVGTKPADKWDSPYEFMRSLVDAIEASGEYEVEQSSYNKVISGFKNARQDIYIDLDKGSNGLTFVDNDGREGYCNVSHYNDPGKKQDTRYEMNYNF